MLDGKYRVDSLMAVGGMGAVYRGCHTKLQKTVAIKVLKRELMASSELVERFQREAVAASQIGHEGIIEVTDIGTSNDGDPFLVMEFLQGRDLASCVKDLGPLKTATAARVCCEILSALAAAHDKSILHRDLKPENIFVCQRSGGESLKILDFGISRMLAEGESSLRLTATGMVMGTPYYMSPEQALGETRADKTADLYSVGVMLYELITGAVPFKATNYNALLHQILAGEYERPSRLADVAPEFEAIITKAMSIPTAHRFGSAREFAAALKPFCESSPTPLLSVHTPHPDTYDDARPVAKRPMGGDVSGIENTMAASSAQFPEAGSDTLRPVVTPIPPPDLPAARATKSYAVIAVLGCLALLGGTVALLAHGDGESDSRERTTAATKAPSASREAESDPVPLVPASTPVEPSLVTLSFAIAPHDAMVFVDGQQIEGTRIEAPPGRFVVEVRREGFASEIRSIDAMSSQKLVFALEELPPALALGSEESGPESHTEAGTASRKEAGKRRVGKRRDGTSQVKNASSETTTSVPNKPSNGRFVEDSPYDAK